MMWSEQRRPGGGGRSHRDLWATGTTLFFPRVTWSHTRALNRGGMWPDSGAHRLPVAMWSPGRWRM